MARSSPRSTRNMKSLFGLDMQVIMFALVAIFAVAVASVAFIFITNRVMFRSGLRNLPRRGLQTGLVVVGLMLATLITTAAFTTGDTIDYSISKASFDDLQHTDLTLNPYGETSTHGPPGSTTDVSQVYFRDSATGALEQQFASDPDIDGFIPTLLEPASASDARTGLSEPNVLLSGVDTQRLRREGPDALGTGTRNIKVETFKKDAVHQAELFGNIFTTFFLVLGLFSIASGVMLIFMIFVMLAAERKPEMGMARAVGAQRGNLVQSFVSEGMAYSLLAGAVGAALGVAAAVALVIGILQTGLGSDASFVEAHVSPTSLIVSYCLGVVITFITVVVSSMQVSSINIVN